DGTPPEELLRIGREQLRPYKGVEVWQTGATGVAGSDGDFVVTLEDGTVVGARKLLLATGVQDDLPERSGFREFWGRGIYHCPYCHGWEMRDRPLAVLNHGEGAVERVALIRNWSRDLILLTDGPAMLDDGSREKLGALGVPINETPISRLEGDEIAGVIRRIVFEDGSEVSREGIFYVPPQRQRSDLAEALGCEFETTGPLPTVIKNDPMTRETTVPGVHVAGDAGTMLQGAIMAAASGASAAAFINHSLVTEDPEARPAS
ncbi:MAG TPA: NAD(P)/FAD-dependent oxidoreductase, partial [Candidatus Eisenbacteria bacterium]|nr:NAD(P)/FAD-dependent oxidoreductase [Candidatus Eisenbacteria bacterium]